MEPFFPVITTALASLVNIYVAAFNTPGVVPSVQSAWETFVHTKCTEAKCAAVQVYDKAKKNMQKHMALLERLIDYDLKEAQRKAELAHMEQERKRIEVI